MAANFEMANADDPEGIIVATQRSVLAGLQGLFKGLQEDIGGPGMTWEQIDLVLTKFKEKKPQIITQERET